MAVDNNTLEMQYMPIKTRRNGYKRYTRRIL